MDEKPRLELLREEDYLLYYSHEHPNIVDIEACYEDTETLWIVLEMLGGGELFDRIEEKQTNSESIASRIFYQMVKSIY